MTADQIPESWHEVLAPEFEQPYFKSLVKFVNDERRAHTVFPPEKDVFNAFNANTVDLGLPQELTEPPLPV